MTYPAFGARFDSYWAVSSAVVPPRTDTPLALTFDLELYASRFTPETNEPAPPVIVAVPDGAVQASYSPAIRELS